MNDEQTTPKAEEVQPTSGEVWREVGEQFQALGESLASAFRTAWKGEKSRQHMQGMQEGLEAMIDEVSAAIRETVSSSEAQRVRSEAGKTAETFIAASEQTIQEARPHLLSALRQVNDELQKLIGRMEQEVAEEKPVSEGKISEPPVSEAGPSDPPVE